MPQSDVVTKMPPRQRAVSPKRVLLALGLGLALTAGPILPVFAQGAPASFADLAEKFSPAVVDITTSSVIAAPADGQPQVPPGSPFEKFFQDFMDQNGQGGGQQQQPERSEALGSGYIISADGYIVTNNHVVEGADDIQIEMFGADKKTFKAKVVGTDVKTDIALLKIESPAPLPFVSFGDSDKMRVGDWVVAMGNPMGQGFSVSAGIVSARGRELNGTYDDFLQTDAAINKGNSGGPLFNMDGQVIGMNTAILSPTGGSVGIGFAIPSDMIRMVSAQLEKGGTVVRGYVGVEAQQITASTAQAMHLKENDGALLAGVQPDGPAAAAGLQPGDVIQAVNGSRIANPKELALNIANIQPGESAHLSVLHDGQAKDVTVKVGTLPNEQTASRDTQATEHHARIGLALAPLSPDMRDQLDIPDGTTGAVVRGVQQGSPADTAGLQPGDLIVAVGGHKVTSPAEATRAMRTALNGSERGIALRVIRNGQPVFVGVIVGDQSDQG